jgi:hypothetical protein
MNGNTMEDNALAVYRFEWENGRTRSTADLEVQSYELVQFLKRKGEADPECEVTLTGYEM